MTSSVPAPGGALPADDVIAAAKRMGRERVSAPYLAAAGIALVFWLAVWIWNAATLPARVPTHWGASPQPDSFMSKPGALLLWVVLTFGIASWLPLLSRLVYLGPDYLNLPDAGWWFETPSRVRRLERLLRQTMWLLVAWLLAFLGCLQVVVHVAATDNGRLPTATFVVLLVVAVSVLGVGLSFALARMLRGSKESFSTSDATVPVTRGT